MIDAPAEFVLFRRLDEAHRGNIKLGRWWLANVTFVWRRALKRGFFADFACKSSIFFDRRGLTPSAWSLNFFWLI